MVPYFMHIIEYLCEGQRYDGEHHHFFKNREKPKQCCIFTTIKTSLNG